jgi:quercetin dioxygenase-like cupin family protein
VSESPGPRASHAQVELTEIEPAGPGSVIRFVRRALGLEAFGLYLFDLPPGAAGREHDESGTGQEEAIVVLAGSGIYRIDETQVLVQEGSVLRFDPQVRRQPIAGDDGLVFIAIGARPGSYEPHGPF